MVRSFKTCPKNWQSILTLRQTSFLSYSLKKSNKNEFFCFQCVNDSTKLPDATLNFIKDKPLMDKPVPPMDGQPLLVRTSLE